MKPDQNPDSVDLKKFSSVVFVCIIVHFVSSLILVVEFVTWFVKLNKQTRALYILNVKLRIRRFINLFFILMDKILNKVFKI